MVVQAEVVEKWQQGIVWHYYWEECKFFFYISTVDIEREEEKGKKVKEKGGNEEERKGTREDREKGTCFQ